LKNSQISPLKSPIDNTHPITGKKKEKISTKLDQIEFPKIKLNNIELKSPLKKESTVADLNFDSIIPLSPNKSQKSPLKTRLLGIKKGRPRRLESVNSQDMSANITKSEAHSSPIPSPMGKHFNK
jgi:hypothetical protein